MPSVQSPVSRRATHPAGVVRCTARAASSGRFRSVQSHRAAVSRFGHFTPIRSVSSCPSASLRSSHLRHRGDERRLTVLGSLLEALDAEAGHHVVAALALGEDPQIAIGEDRGQALRANIDAEIDLQPHPSGVPAEAW
jgi:hypothetical protein